MSSPEAASTVFVGSISPGVPDRWVSKLLEACGGLRRWKRVSKAFGFADYQNAPDVLRVTAVLHDLELPSMGAEHTSAPKRLVVKADDKTNRFLGEFEKTLVRTDLDRQKEREARRRVEHLVSMMRSRATDASEVDSSVYEIPAHLKDLPADQLRGAKRVHVLSEIEKFRLSAVARDAAERKRDLELERKRSLLSQERRTPHELSATPEPVAQEQDPEGADEEAEQRRQRAVAERRDREAREAEHAYAEREYARLRYWQRNAEEQLVDRPVTFLREDQELTHEIFWTDRRRWLKERAPLRRAEQAADAEDRDAEAAEQEQARQEAEAFLQEQAKEMAKLAEEQKQSGLLLHTDGQPLKIQVRPQDEGRKKRQAILLRLPSNPSREMIQEVLPVDTQDVFSIPPDWDKVDEALRQNNYNQLLDTQIEECLGEAVDDLRDATLERVREHAPASELIKVLDPVLEEDAHSVVACLWRAMLVDTLL
ncbi:hypothetical protein MYAM1_001599 [Malassezia yamatoensis]|uniref:U1 snRNP-associated protein usp107 n=1 Tax=Malassezia yamatoensis TaxID=253288 RepID=A0AAJ5YS55_9BASI|nr:hypothetical protein MYAM1_001599 [Malassezia yamatoensis]